MSETIKLRKGLDIRLKGRAAETVTRLKPSAEYSLVPDDFVGVTPKVAVKERPCPCGRRIVCQQAFP